MKKLIVLFGICAVVLGVISCSPKKTGCCAGCEDCSMHECCAACSPCSMDQ